jgi:YfiH family protein
MNIAEHWLTPDWPAPANIHAATTLRTGGVSEPPYSSLNPALHVGDLDSAVMENRRIIKNMLSLPAEPFWLNQIHSSIAVDAAITDYLPSADASYTSKPGIVCAVMTADCLPLLLCAADGARIAAIHAGWRGLLAGIIRHTVKALAKTNLLVWLGPAIGPASFEVGSEVREAFLAKSNGFANAFSRQDNGKWLADIYLLARHELTALGISQIYGGDFCTLTDQARFYSFRRDPKTGRMVSLIWRD